MFEHFKNALSSFFKEPLKESFEINEKEVLRRISDGTVERVNWNELTEVRIITTDQGPYFEDLFFILESKNGGTVISNEWAVKLNLFDYFKNLENFDNEAVIKAMSCTDNNTFIIWQAAKGTVNENPMPLTH
ncbi:MAG: hypothetical protein K2X27_01785 [Candidatus Obscuribacterales bacterium]|nr:hypothetical protein [Candidatus Obscuribacterales bacterium]